MKEIVFVTSNENKVKTAQKHLSEVKLIHYNRELVEPRSDSIEEIAKYKVMQAYELLKKECIALDSGFFIDALNNWPGTFVNYNLNSLGLNKILKLLENEENRKAHFAECLAYYDGKDVRYFYGISKGSISNNISNVVNSDGWSSLWEIFIPLDCNKVMSEMTQEERINRPDGHTNSFVEFNNWILSRKK